MSDDLMMPQRQSPGYEPMKQPTRRWAVAWRNGCRRLIQFPDTSDTVTHAAGCRMQAMIDAAEYG
jgi:hypothetical protein